MRFLTLAAGVLFSAFSLADWQPLKVSGRVLNEANQPVSSATVKVAGRQVNTDKKGRFSFNLNGQDRYQFELQSPGFYTRIHNFSHGEIQAVQGLDFVLVKKVKGRVMMAFGGDVMMGRRYMEPYFDDPVLLHSDSMLSDSKAILSHIKPYLTLADFAAVNLESQISHDKPSQRAAKSVTFYSQPEIVQALQWAGIDYVTLGNNHTYDYLDEGLTSTLAALDKHGLSYSGAGMTEQQALAPYIYETKKADYAMLGYVGWAGSKSPYQAATPDQGGAAYGTMENIQAAVKLAKNQQQLPVVQYHGSLEYSNEPTGVTEQRLKSAIDSGAVLAVAHHPHVAQGLEVYNDQLIAYSMGNFVFDQNFSSTQLSFLLYVWMDGGKLHRAEVVPVYVKGYKPTPALGEERENLLKRLIALSAKRNTHIQTVAGHGVIANGTQSGVSVTTQAVNLNQITSHSVSFPTAESKITRVNLGDSGLRYRLGTNLVNGSDFERFDSFDTLERGFVFDKSQLVLSSSGHKSDRSVKLDVPNDSSQTFGMKHFRRVYKPSNPVTLKMDVKVDKPVKVNLYWQGRKTRQKLFDAFENSPKNLIGSVDLAADSKWKSLELNFNSPRIGYRSYRVLAEFVNSSGKKVSVDIDNFALLQWHTAFSNQPEPMITDDGGKMANYIGFNKTSDKVVSVEVK